jgi:hypothetical protein
MKDFEMELGELIARHKETSAADMIEAMDTYIAMLDSKQERELVGATAPPPHAH